MKYLIALTVFSIVSFAQAGPGQFVGRTWNCAGLNTTGFASVEASVSELIIIKANGEEETDYRLQVGDDVFDASQKCANGESLFQFNPETSLQETDHTQVYRLETAVSCESEIYYDLYLHCTQEELR